MTKYILTISFFIMLSFKINAKPILYFKNSPPFDSLGVIVALKNYNKTDFDKVKTAITNMQGVKYTAFCGNHNIYMFYIDKNIYAEREKFLQQMEATDITLEPLIFLKNGNITEFLNFCSFTDPNDAANNKH